MRWPTRSKDILLDELEADGLKQYHFVTALLAEPGRSTHEGSIGFELWIDNPHGV